MDKKIEQGFDLVPFHKDIAEYFSRFRFIEGTNNAYSFLLRALKGKITKREVILASLNYDILLDLAVQKEFGTTKIYGEIEKGALLIKPHGSCNFLSFHPNVNTNSLSVMVKKDGISQFDFPTAPSFAKPEVLLKAIRDDPVPPYMRIYASEKLAPIGVSWLNYQQSMLIKNIENAQKVIVVGVRVNYADMPIWGELIKSPAEIYLVNMDQGSRDFLLNRYGNDKNLINDYFEISNPKVLRQIIRVSKSLN
jgi:hypothetical protein